MLDRVCKWAWRYHVLDVDFFDSISDAVSAAEHAAGMGEESLECIEVIEDGQSRVLTTEEYHAVADPIEEEERLRLQAVQPSTVVLKLASPNGSDWATYQGYAEPQKAEGDAARLRELLGADRVRVEPVRRGAPF